MTSMDTIYILWLRQMKKFRQSGVRMIISVVQPLVYLLGLGFGLNCNFQTIRSWKLYSVCSSGHHCPDYFVLLHFLGCEPDLGQTVWFPQRNAGSPCVEDYCNVGRRSWRSYRWSDTGCGIVYYRAAIWISSI